MPFTAAAPRRIVAWLAEALDGLGQNTDFVRSLQDVCRASGAKHGAFVMRHVPGVLGDDPFVVDTFGEAWHRHAAINDYAPTDPVSNLAERSIHPYDWSELPRPKGRLKRFQRDFQTFQLGRQAVTATFRGPSGDRSSLTLTSDCTEKRWQATRHDVVAAMGLLHPAFHAAVLRIRFAIESHDAAKLTPREKQCLGWAAHGRTSKEIGENLGLTPSTVNFFIDAACGKLAASNRAHAAAKAVALGLIAPPR
jgi:DNA-binding CsgD family transcriptional regulator